MERRHFLRIAGLGVAAPAVMRVSRANAAEVTLKMHHFLPPVSNGHARFLKPWSDKVAAESGGRIKIDIYPSMQLGGAPPQLFDQARDGVADLVWTLPGNTPGRFPGIETFELPFVAAKKAMTNSRALQQFAEQHLKDEFREVHPICFWTHDHGLLHTSRPVARMEDLAGMKIRFPTRLAGEGLKALGANPIGMPIPQVPESLAQKVIEGCVVPWEVAPTIKVHELVKNHLEIPGSPTFYVATFVLAMNKPKYESLPADLKAVLDRNSGLVAAEMAGKVWDDQSVTVSEMIRKRGNNVSTLSAEEYTRWRKVCAPVTETWIKAVKEKGLDGGKLLAAAEALLAAHAG
ncbi:MAG: TRAP transporter substrate-binding protein [Proteobacteria bacterium]|nr:TRAP transporter substrate-binding protein [Pseudomonadota bacterium]